MLISQFCLGSISDGFGAIDSTEISLKVNVNDFSVDYVAIDKSDISNDLKYFMVKNNLKRCLCILNKCYLDYYVLVNL